MLIQNPKLISIVQRSNLLSHCDINGNGTGDVVIEDSLVTRCDIG
jgi:hypothetical protein